MDGVRTPGVRTWRGPDDLRRLQLEMPCTSPDPRGFQAEERVIASGGVALRDWRSTALSGVDPSEDREPSIRLLVVLAGEVRLAAGGRQWVGATGTVHLLRSEDRVQWSVAHGTRLVRIQLPVVQIPPHLRTAATAVPGPVAGSRISVALGSAAQQSTEAATAAPSAATYLVRGLQNLALALLEELPSTGASGADDLRARIIAHIEHHLEDPDLNPRAIATAFSVSLRWVHQAFSTSGTSLARYIRHRRVDSVAAVLRGDRRTPRTGALAIRFGFSGREHLARSFRSRYGVTVTAYHGLVLDGLPLPEPRADVEADAGEDQVA